ncbi:MAG: rhomboid family intramembrane serine protease [Thermodesulfobacteriaceae bacterium]|nr:rhomboid family intramembrane serine protease [Thermodesulfobacteriaceae bacterium]MCX8041747.1 rhomboid family intramembrane serine protease [Thermodesulfobacteriaceae bacterium]MDW8136298.1 rhomboid family intramembrane serine protease [Thermodesulfobacterium sp.]
MIPLQDILPRRNPPVITWLLILINLLVFLYELSLPLAQRELFFRNWGFVPAKFFNDYFGILLGAPWYQKYLAFFTHLFIHGGWFHLIGNMWTLWIFGDNVEDRLGPFRFLIFYLSCGFLATLTHALIYHDSVIPVVGASGAISAVMGAYFMMYPLARILVLMPIFFVPLFFEIPAFLYLGYWFLIQFYSGLFSLVLPESFGGIAWFAHIGGFVGGALFYRFFCPRRCKFYRDEYSIFGSLFNIDKKK